jgi:hypothetical protein
MSTVAISQLPVATVALSTDEIPIVQSGTTKKLTNAQLFTNATFVAPALGTPASGTLTNCTGLPIINGTTGTLSVARGGTGTTSSTGSGNAVLSTGPTLVTPTLGVATATSVNKVAITAPATSATLTIVDGKTLTASHSLTLAGTDSTTMTFPSTSASIARTDAAQTFTGNQTFNGPVIESVQALSGAGAINITQPVTKFTSTATGNALTLADGVEGQIKTIVYVAEAAGGDTGVLTPTNLGAGTTITFNAIGDACILQFLNTDWWAISLRGAVLA